MVVRVRYCNFVLMIEHFVSPCKNRILEEKCRKLKDLIKKFDFFFVFSISRNKILLPEVYYTPIGSCVVYITAIKKKLYS